MATAMPRPAALIATLDALVGATDALTIAVERHDLSALMAASDQAEKLTSRVDTIAAELDSSDRVELDTSRIAELRDRLAVGARRNAYLIERAWALDASTMRLLAGVGQDTSDGLLSERSANGYLPIAASAMYLDREA
jgi:hypothetical protein